MYLLAANNGERKTGWEEGDRAWEWRSVGRSVNRLGGDGYTIDSGMVKPLNIRMARSSVNDAT